MNYGKSVLFGEMEEIMSTYLTFNNNAIDQMYTLVGVTSLTQEVKIVANELLHRCWTKVPHKGIQKKRIPRVQRAALSAGTGLKHLIGVN